MKKIITICLILVCCFYHIQPVFAANTYTAVFEKTNSEYFSLADGSETGINISGDFTLEIWVKLSTDVSPTGNWAIFWKSDNAVNGGYNMQWVSSLDRMYSTWGNSGASNNNYCSFPWATYKGTWTHIAVTVDVSTKATQFYINGSSVSSTNDGTATTLTDNAVPFLIGVGWQSGTVTAGYYDGDLDDARVWSDIRTGTEIGDNYNCQLDGDEAGLEGYWEFSNDGLDTTTNNNDLTNNNTVTFQSGSLPFTASCSAAPATDPCTPTAGQPFFQSQDCYLTTDVYHNDKWIDNGHKLIYKGGKLILE